VGLPAKRQPLPYYERDFVFHSFSNYGLMRARCLQFSVQAFSDFWDSRKNGPGRAPTGRTASEFPLLRASTAWVQT